jgi:hypothetical protein
MNSSEISSLVRDVLKDIQEVTPILDTSSYEDVGHILHNGLTYLEDPKKLTKKVLGALGLTLSNEAKKIILKSVKEALALSEQRETSPLWRKNHKAIYDEKFQGGLLQGRPASLFESVLKGEAQ